MLKRLQIKIIVVVMGTLLVVFSAVLLVLNLSVYSTSLRRTEGFMENVIENDGFSFPPPGKPDVWNEERREKLGNPEMMRAGRFFYAKIDTDGEITELNLDMMFDFSSEDALLYISDVLASGRGKGNIGNFSYLLSDKPYGLIVVFAERSIEIHLLEQLTGTSIWTAGAVGLILACLSAVFAKWMVAPVKTAFEKQQRFISDASHELKTPLTIIGANVDVLKNEMGANKRLEHIKSQSERMNNLVHDLLVLAKTDEQKSTQILSEFNLSGTVLNTVLEFESRAFEGKKQYSYEIDENILYTGDCTQIKQLLSILIDNAIQYSGTGGQIKISLHTNGNRPCISVFNTGDGVPAEEYGKIFERFYRSDESRSRETGGYGIGLSIAESIVKSCKGKISVSGEHGKWIRFDILL